MSKHEARIHAGPHAPGITRPDISLLTAGASICCGTAPCPSCSFDTYPDMDA
ncbi:MAG: hypothetical protein OXC07_09270 [Kistimonas sp.]|nr:hypothetical protein [Kistimonas sp.]